MNKKNTITWIVLMILMLFNFWLAELNPNYVKYTLAVILFITLIKFLGVAFRFMDLKDAHKGWKTLFVGFIITFVIIIGLV